MGRGEKIVRNIVKLAKRTAVSVIQKGLSLEISTVETEKGGSAEPYVIIHLSLYGEPIGKMYELSAEPWDNGIELVVKRV